jgi:hypothetical protein
MSAWPARRPGGNPAEAGGVAQITEGKRQARNFLAHALVFQNIPIVFIGLLRSNNAA